MVRTGNSILFRGNPSKSKEEVRQKRIYRVEIDGKQVDERKGLVVEPQSARTAMENGW